MRDTGEYARSLLDAQSEEDVTRILDRLELNENCSWVPAGSEQNYSITFSNTADPVASFAELIVNSFDAVLMKRYHNQFGDEYDPETGLITVDDAVSELFEDPDDHDEIVEVIADGDPKGSPNLTVRDTGTGQPHECFADRFLKFAVGGQVKDDWPFTQGRFKMGSAAVLPHSGDKEYKLIASAPVSDPGSWSWSIIRDHPGVGVYKHLLIDGDVGQFSGELRGQSYGTFTKVYEYNIGRAHITGRGSLRGKLERVLVDPAIPFHMRETRKSTSDSNEQDVRGLYGRLNHWNVDSVVKMDRQIRHNFGEPFGERKVRVVVFKHRDTIKNDDNLSKNPKDEFVAGNKHREQAVMYLVNGQAHAHDRRTFLTGSRGCQYKHTGKDMAVFMDLSDFGDKQRHDRRDFLELFRPSRDEMGGSDIADQLRDELARALKNDPALQDEEEWRRNRVTQNKRDEHDTDIMESMLEQNPTMRRYFQTGTRVPTAGTTTADGGEYNAPYYPTHLHVIKQRHNDGTVDLWDESKGLFRKHQPTNRNAQVQFDLDAQNDYFDRATQPGVLSVNGVDRESWGLHNGVLSIRFGPNEGVEPGDTARVTVTVSREMADPLRCVFTVKYVDPVEKTSGGDNGEAPPASDTLDFPDVTRVYESGEDVATWADMSPEWSEHDVVDIHEYDDGHDIYVNMDAAPLHNFIRSNNLTDNGKDRVKEIWVAGHVFYALSQYIELDDEDVAPEEIVPVTMRGVAQSMLDQHIGEKEMERLTV